LLPRKINIENKEEKNLSKPSWKDKNLPPHLVLLVDFLELTVQLKLKKKMIMHL
jgi:hypothetical protein